MMKQELFDFLATYGWAILVVLVAIATLAYFGYQPMPFATITTSYNVSDVCEISGDTTMTKQMIDNCCIIDNVSQTAQCRFKSPTYVIGE